MEESVYVKEAAEMLGYSTGYVSKLCKEGKFDIKVSKENGKWKIPVVAIEEFKRRKEGKKK